MENTGTIAYQITHPDLLTWISDNLILIGIVAICVFLLYLYSTRDKSKDWGVQEDDDYTIENEHTGGKPMKSKEYYAKIKSGEIVLPKSNTGS